MRAVGYHQSLPIDAPNALEDLILPRPEPGPRDLLVAVKAVSVNPVDTKVRQRRAAEGGEPVVLGWDAAGTVEAVGTEVTRFRPGDAVFYAGVIDRPGTNAEYHCVDERIVGHKPQSIGWAEAAALPLTSITAWEALFDKLDVTTPVPGAAGAVLIVNGAGGVGSIAIQLLRAKTDLTVIASASRDETVAWVTELGAHHVVNHREAMAAQVEALGLGGPGHVFSTTHTDDHLADIAELLSPNGHLALIDDPKALDIVPLKQKGLSVHWELMFTRPLFHTADMGEQGRLLDEVAELVDAGTVRSTIAENAGPINASNLIRAHALIESGKAKGKIVLEGFG